MSQAGFTAIDDLVHGFGGGYLPPVVPAPGQKHAATASMAALRQPHAISIRSATSTRRPLTHRFGGYAEGRVEQSTVESLFPGSVKAVPPVFPNDTGHSSKDNPASPAVDWTNNSSQRTVKGPKRHQAVSINVYDNVH